MGAGVSAAKAGAGKINLAAKKGVRRAKIGASTMASKLGLKLPFKVEDAPPMSPTVLRVTVHDGRNLPAKDDNGLSDPYLVLLYGSEKEVKTDIRKMSLTPHWNQQFDIPVWNNRIEFNGLGEFPLDVKCWDWNKEGEDHSFMGQVEVEIGQLKLDGEGESNYFVLTDPADPSCEGEVHLTLQWITRPDGRPDSLLTVKVIAGRDLPALDPSGFSDPYVVVKFQGVVHKTRHITRTLDPDFHELFEYEVMSTDVGGETLYVEVWDKGQIYDRMMGIIPISISDLQYGQAWEEWHGLMPPPKKGEKNPEASLKKKKDDDDSEDLGRLHLEIKLKKNRSSDAPDLILRVQVTLTLNPKP